MILMKIKQSSEKLLNPPMRRDFLRPNKFPGKSRLFRFILFLLLLNGCQSAQTMWLEKNPVKKMVFHHAKREKNRYNLELIAMSAPPQGKREPFYVHYISRERVKIPEARKILLDAAESFLQLANENEALKEVLENNPLTVEEITINIGFLKIDESFQEPPYIAYAYVKQGCIHYCYYDNLFGKFTQYDDVKEPFQTAKIMIRETVQ